MTNQVHQVILHLNYEYKLNKGKTTNDRIVDKLRENGLDEDATLLPEAQELYPQFKTQKGEAFDRLERGEIVKKRISLIKKDGGLTSFQRDHPG